jgi:spore coat assembly protein
MNFIGDDAMNIGDIVVRKSYGRDVVFKIIDEKYTDEGVLYTIKGVNLRVVADSPESDLELILEERITDKEKLINNQIKSSIKSILSSRGGGSTSYRVMKQTSQKQVSQKQTKDLTFGRPGRVLHIDGDSEYLNNCLKVYKQLSLEVVGKTISEENQPSEVVNLIKEVKPDIVVITGHDAIVKGTKNFMDLNNYKNSRYFVETVLKIRDYEPNYDDLVIFAGACQSCYEAILDAGANFASSPNRVLIHCLDPVFLCEKIAYTNFEKVVSIQDALENTITGTKGIGGMQTRGKYREGFPKSPYI